MTNQPTKNKRMRAFPDPVQWYIIITIVICLLIILEGIVFTQDIKPSQSVYVVASRIDNAKPDLTVEAKAKREFQKRKKFDLAQSPTDADFVCLLLTEYDSYSYGALAGNTTTLAGSSGTYNYVRAITAIIVPAKAYAERKDDLEKLREVAVWQGAVTAGMREASASNLVKTFHEAVKK